MAYTAVVEKKSVNKISDNIYSVSVELTVNDGQDDVFSTTASAKYNSNTANMDDIKSALTADIKDKWDKWAAENNIYTASAFNTMVGEIQTQANNYINQ